MHRTRFLPAALLAALFVLTVSGCDAINEASATLDKAEVCTKALSAAGFSPDLSNPLGAVEEAQRKADELRGLADQTSDANLQRELRETADQIGSLQQSDVSPADIVTWSSRKLDQVTQLTQACG